MYPSKPNNNFHNVVFKSLIIFIIVSICFMHISVSIVLFHLLILELLDVDIRSLIRCSLFVSEEMLRDMEKNNIIHPFKFRSCEEEVGN